MKDAGRLAEQQILPRSATTSASAAGVSQEMKKEEEILAESGKKNMGISNRRFYGNFISPLTKFPQHS